MNVEESPWEHSLPSMRQALPSPSIHYKWSLALLMYLIPLSGQSAWNIHLFHSFRKKGINGKQEAEGAPLYPAPMKKGLKRWHQLASAKTSTTLAFTHTGTHLPVTCTYLWPEHAMVALLRQQANTLACKSHAHNSSFNLNKKDFLLGLSVLMAYCLLYITKV